MLLLIHFPVEVKLANTHQRIRPGMFGRVTVSFGTLRHVVVPDQAIVKRAGSGDRYVYVYKDGKVSYNKVELGRRMGTEYELISGVEDNSQVVVAGQTRLADGVEVAVLINGSMDSFLFTYVRRLLEDGGSFIHLYYFSSGSEEYVGQIYKINKQYANRVHLYPLVEIEDLVLPIIHGLLILSYDTCVGIAANEKVFKALPSLLVMKDAS